MPKSNRTYAMPLTPFSAKGNLLWQLIKNGSVRGWLFFACGIPMSFIWDVNIWVLTLTDFFLAGLFLVWIIPATGKASGSILLNHFKPITERFVLFVIWGAMTIVLNMNDIPPASAINLVLRTIKFFLYGSVLIIMCRDWYTKTRGPTYLFWGFIVGLAIQGIVAAGQIPGDQTAVYDDDDDASYAQEKTRRTDALGIANATGSVLAPAIVLLLPLFLQKRDPLIGGLVGLMSIALFAGLSRGAWVALLVGLVVLYGGARKRMGVLFAIVAIIWFGAHSEIVQKRIFTAQQADDYGTETYDGNRIKIPMMVLTQHVPKSPLWGRGFYGRFGNPFVMAYGSHNIYVQILWETGVIGLAVFLGVIFKLWKHVGTIKETDSRRHIMAVMVTILFAGLAGEFLLYGPILSCYILLIAYPYLIARGESLYRCAKEKALNMQPRLVSNG